MKTNKTIEKTKTTNTTTPPKRLSAFGKFMQENRGMIEIIDMRAVMK